MIEAAILLLLQIAAIAVTAQLVASLLRRLGQPSVVGQLVAGIFLGASVFGVLAGPLQAALFPASSLPLLRFVGQLGVVIYMFFIGFRVHHGSLRHHAHGALAVASAGAAVPLLAAAAFAILIAGDHRFFPARVPPLTAILFFAAAMAVTAFPVMARIIDDRHLNGTRIADIGLAAGSVSDVIAWCLLAVVLSSLVATFTGALLTIAGAALFVLVALFPVRRFLQFLVESGAARRGPPGWTVPVVGLLLVAAAVLSERIGIHPAFGAFVLGTVVPRRDLVGQWPARLSAVAVPLLLPAYFAYSGLNTRIGLIGSIGLIMLTGVIIVIASVSKGMASAVAARLAGISTREAIAIGSLMNARGLVELVLLNTGLEKGVITPTLFSMLVAMAVITTFATAPILGILYPSGTLPPSHKGGDPGDGVEVLGHHVLVADDDGEALL